MLNDNKLTEEQIAFLDEKYGLDTRLKIEDCLKFGDGWTVAGALHHIENDGISFLADPPLPAGFPMDENRNY